MPELLVLAFFNYVVSAFRVGPDGFRQATLDSTGDTDGSLNLLAAAGIDRLLLLNENSGSALFSGKKFTSWDECEMFLNEWTKQQGFHLIKDYVTRDDGIICRRIFIYSHGRTYESNSSRNTATKKLNCPFSINVSCPKKQKS
ncbi:unnamed protein product [Rhizophagus irregularis]|nr:unnamed protein product [Rhizophagus irregularis]